MWLCELFELLVMAEPGCGKGSLGGKGGIGMGGTDYRKGGMGGMGFMGGMGLGGLGGGMWGVLGGMKGSWPQPGGRSQAVQTCANAVLIGLTAETLPGTKFADQEYS